MKRGILIKILNHLLPSKIMLLVMSLTLGYFSGNDAIDWKGLFILSIFLLFPILFLIQGIVCAVRKINLFISFGISILTFIILSMIYLNSTAFVYVPIYLVVGFLGYFIGKFMIVIRIRS